MTSQPGVVVPETIAADVVVVGSGAAGLMAVRHAHRANPTLRIALISKGLIGRSGCSAMALGLNAALGDDDDPSLHFDDLVRTGDFLSDQSLAWTLASDAPTVARELADELGCVFDRTPGGQIALAAFPGQSRRRKVAHGHRTGLEIVTRLRDDLSRSRPIQLPDTRVIELLHDDAGVTGVVALDIHRGRFLVLQSPVVVLAAGGSAASSFRVATPAREKAGDGLAIALRAGLPLRDMEMVQFLSVGLALAGSKLTGSLLEEALRFAGAELLNAGGERFMARYDERAEKAPRDVVARACYAEIADGRGTSDGAVLLDCRPIGRVAVVERFGDVSRRAALAGFDLASEPVPIAPASHIGIGGVVIDADCRTDLPGLLVAGEDAGGVHGASWAGGNGIAESTVFGARAGRAAATAARERRASTPGDAATKAAIAKAVAVLGGACGPSPVGLAEDLGGVLYENVALRRDAVGLRAASAAVSHLRELASRVRVGGGLPSNGQWQDALDLESRLSVADAVIQSAAARTETRGVHVRTDHPARDDASWLRTIVVRQRDEPQPRLAIETWPIVMDRLVPDAPLGERAR